MFVIYHALIQDVLNQMEREVSPCDSDWRLYQLYELFLLKEKFETETLLDANSWHLAINQDKKPTQDTCLFIASYFIM